MSNPSWRTLLAASVIVAINPATLRATPPTDNAPVYRPISLDEFQKMVWAGKEIRGRLVPSDHIKTVFEHADENLLKQSPYAHLWLSSSKVTDGTIQPEGPTREVQTYSEEIRKHLGNGNKTAVYLALPIDITDTDFDANLDLDGVVIEKPITLDNVDFSHSVSFYGAVFRSDLVLQRIHFRGVTDFSHVFLDTTTLSFRYCDFDFPANFAGITIPGDSTLYIGGDHISAPLNFYGSRISGALRLEGVEERTLQVDHSVYLNGVNGGPGAPVGKLSLEDIVFHDNVYMDHSKWAQLDLGEAGGGRGVIFDGVEYRYSF